MATKTKRKPTKKKPVVKKPADKDGFTQQQLDKLDDLAKTVQEAQRNCVQSLLAICKAIKTAHDLLAKAGRNGKFRPWVETNCRMSHTKAYECIDIYDRFAEHMRLMDYFDDSAVRLLAKDTTPEIVFNRAISVAQDRTFVDRDKVKELLEKVTVNQDAPSQTSGTNRKNSDNSVPMSIPFNADAGADRPDEPDDEPPASVADLDDEPESPVPAHIDSLNELQRWLNTGKELVQAVINHGSSKETERLSKIISDGSRLICAMIDREQKTPSATSRRKEPVGYF